MTIEAMKQALEALKECNSYLGSPDLDEPIATLSQAIEQAEKQEPVVWMYQDKSTHEVRFQKHMRGFVDHGATYETPLYTTPQPQEFVCSTGLCHYTQPQREWQGLTDDEVTQQVGDSHVLRDVVRAVEHVLKEKNT
jgi:hypothetical protein